MDFAALPIHTPSVLLLATLAMGSAATILSLLALGRRVYRGYWCWVVAIWLAAGGIGLQLLRPAWPAAAVPANLLVLAWPLLVVTGLRRFEHRGPAPTSAATDLVVFLLCYLAWLGAWAGASLAGWRTPVFCLGVVVQSLYAAWVIRRLDDRRGGPALRALVVVMLLQVPVPLLAVGTALWSGSAALPDMNALLPAFAVPTMVAVLFTVCLCLVLTHERTERDLRETQRQLRVLADTDMLTQVPNRRHFEELARATLARRSGERAVLVLFDIDHFKRINDTHGHAVGDDALRVVARCTRSLLRARDVLGRVGGDEFMLLLPGASVEDALTVADRITRRIDRERAAHQAVTLSLSFGVIEIEREESLDSAQHRADMALYEAKRQGRRRAVPASGAGSDTKFGESRSFEDDGYGLNT